MMARLRRLTTERSAAVIVFMLVFAMALRVSADSDLWWHLSSGKHILESGLVIYPDPFSHSFAGVVHHNHSAIADVLMYGIWRGFGHAGMALFMALLAFGGMFFVYNTCAGSVYPRAFLLVLGAATASVYWSPRPQMFTFLFMAILLWILQAYKRGRRNRCWWIAPLMWLWCNAHGGYFIGYVIIGAFVLGELLNAGVQSPAVRLSLRSMHRLVITTLASIPLLALNPIGTRIFAIPFDTVGMPELSRYIQEWQSPNFNEAQTWPFILLLILAVGAGWASRLSVDMTDWLLLVGSALMALVAARNMSLFAVVAVPIASNHMHDILRRRGWVILTRDTERPGRLMLNLLLIALVAIGTGLRIKHVLHVDSASTALAARMPIVAVEGLNTMRLEGNMFNSYNWGGYLMFHAPQHRVFIDGRTDLYRDFLNAYYRIASGVEGWREGLQDWDIAFAVIESESGLAKRMSAAGDWLRVYHDPLASVFVREDKWDELQRPLSTIQSEMQGR